MSISFNLPITHTKWGVRKPLIKINGVLKTDKTLPKAAIELQKVAVVFFY